MVDPREKSGGLLLGWSDDGTIYQIHTSQFSIEVELETSEFIVHSLTNGKMWAVFIYASNKEKVRVE